jgi:L-histidine Nalpha-methyltransferase
MEYFASPEMQICRRFRTACCGAGSTILHKVSPGDPVQEFADAAASGLLSAPRRLESRFLYDAEGSALFEKITRQPEYYLTATETSILSAHASSIRDLTGPIPLLELGSGSCAKIEFLLRAWLERVPETCYVPVDVSESALAGACDELAGTLPQVRVIGVNAEYHEAFPLLHQLSPALLLFLGSSIGNLAPAEMSRFLAALTASMDAGHFLLLGVDLVKERELLEAAYNDAAGITAQFTRNVFARMNRELGCSIDLDAIEHVARYHEEREQIETFAHFTRQQTVWLGPLHRQLTIPQGEMVQIEISRKFRLETLVPELRELGLAAEEIYTDPRGWFALLLLRRQPPYLSTCRRS